MTKSETAALFALETTKTGRFSHADLAVKHFCFTWAVKTVVCAVAGGQNNNASATLDTWKRSIRGRPLVDPFREW
jgi:hypothetical protein